MTDSPEPNVPPRAPFASGLRPLVAVKNNHQVSFAEAGAILANRAAGTPDLPTKPPTSLDEILASMASGSPMMICNLSQPTPPDIPLTPPWRGFELSVKQQQAIDALCVRSSQVRILVGSAGTGKTTIIEAMADQVGRKNVTRCATTGRAALAIDGPTVDRLFAYSRSEGAITDDKRLAANMEEAGEYIIVDEASMMDANMFRAIYDACKEYGKQLILVGDWGQACPVKGAWPFGHTGFKNAHIIKLKERFRQRDEEFLDVLDRCRLGVPTDADVAYFAGNKIRDIDVDALHLFATKRSAECHNLARLRALKSAISVTMTLTMTYEDFRDRGLQRLYPVTERDRETAFEASRLGHGVPLKIGARVVITKNEGEAYCNGDQGSVADILYDDGDGGILLLSEFPFQLTAIPNKVVSIVVQLDRGPVVDVGESTENIRDGKRRVIAVLRGFPLALGYGLTGHKSQGMTTDHYAADLDSLRSWPEIPHGLGYVMVSRGRTPQGTRTHGVATDLFFSHPDTHFLI